MKGFDHLMETKGEEFVLVDMFVLKEFNGMEFYKGSK